MTILRFASLAMLATFALVKDGIAQSDEAARSIALFREAGKVLQHPRCLNCHPATDRPTQTDTMRPHVPRIVRGADGHGPPGLPFDPLDAIPGRQRTFHT